MIAKRKCSNNPFWINNVTGHRADKISPLDRALGVWSYWHSELEWKVYQDLRLNFPQECIVRQVEVEVVPKSENFGAVRWDVDFAVKTVEGGCVLTWHYIEAKGDWILEDSSALTGFTRLVKTLAYHNPTIYSRLHLVGYRDFNLSEDIQVKNYKGIGKRIG